VSANYALPCQSIVRVCHKLKAAAMARRLANFDKVYATDLLEAELRSACRREHVAVNPRFTDQLVWVRLVRSLSPEISRVLEAGYVRGADCWHLAAALYLAPEPIELTFVTLDERQGAVAKTLGFAT